MSCPHNVIDMKIVGKHSITAICGDCGKTINISPKEFLEYKFHVITPSNDGVWKKKPLEPESIKVIFS